MGIRGSLAPKSISSATLLLMRWRCKNAGLERSFQSETFAILET